MWRKKEGTRRIRALRRRSFELGRPRVLEALSAIERLSLLYAMLWVGNWERREDADTGGRGSSAGQAGLVALPTLEAISTVGPRSRKAVAGTCPPAGRYTQYTESETLVDRPAGSLPSGSLSSPVRASSVEATLLKNPPSSTRERGALESFLPVFPSWRLFDLSGACITI
jgi:hypothetical protein